ncbi:hypothetical protein Tco_0605451 [Tanacetum coccineum]
MNTTVGEEDENEVEEVRRRKPMGRDQAKRKMKAGSASSASSFDVEALAKMMASEYVMASDPYNFEKKAGVGTQSCGGGNSTYEEPSKRRSVI